ncbi:triose-phosphate isomerase [bacterium]|nr:triose-phosphate isomerase [bacterium]
MKPLIVGNWKMNINSLTETKKLFNSIKRKAKGLERKAEIVVCPSSAYLSNLKTQNSSVVLGAQDLFWENEGNFTGNISPLILKETDCKYVLVGHSERRKHNKETNEMISKKLKKAIDNGFKVILCVGETATEKKTGQALRVLNTQVSKALNRIDDKEIKNVIIAYEPVWAVGTGKPCESSVVLTQNLLIRNMIKKRYSSKIAKDFKILYGGSVNSDNAKEYIDVARTQGLLIGEASLNSQEFIKIIKNI